MTASTTAPTVPTVGAVPGPLQRLQDRAHAEALDEDAARCPRNPVDLDEWAGVVIGRVQRNPTWTMDAALDNALWDSPQVRSSK